MEKQKQDGQQFNRIIPADQALGPLHAKIGELVMCVDVMTKQLGAFEKENNRLRKENDQLKNQLKSASAKKPGAEK